MPCVLLLAPIITHILPLLLSFYLFQFHIITHLPLNKQVSLALLTAQKTSTTDPWWASVAFLSLISHRAKGGINCYSLPKILHQTTFYSLTTHFSSTIFSLTILPATHTTTSLHQHWPLLIQFPFSYFLNIVKWLSNLFAHPFISAPSFLPIPSSPLTLSPHFSISMSFCFHSSWGSPCSWSAWTSSTYCSSLTWFFYKERHILSSITEPHAA